MAYGIIYTGSLIDHFGRTLTVKILENGYSGASTPVTLAGVTLTLNGDDENVFKNILSTSVSVGLLSETDFQFINLFTGDKRKYRMDIERDSVLKWRGWLVPDLYTEAYSESENYITTITARDGLVELETIPFDQTGVKSHDELVQRAMTEVTSDTNDMLYVGINTFEENHVTTESPLSQTYVDCIVYEGKSYKEVLFDICQLYKARVYQKNGDFWMVSTFEFKSAFNWTKYNGVGVVVDTGTEDTEIVAGLTQQDKWANQDQQLNILPPWKDVTVNKDLSYRDSALENYDFDYWVNNSTPNNWFLSSSSMAQRYSTENKTAIRYNSFASTVNPTSGDYIFQQLPSVIGNKHGLKLNIRFKILDLFSSIEESQFWVKIVNSDGLGNNAWLTADGTWALSESFINFQNIPIKTEESATWLEYEISNSDRMPLSGSLNVYVYSAENATLVLDYINLQMTFPVIAPISPDQFGVYPDDDIVDIYPISNNTYSPEKLDLLSGDLPDLIDVGINPYDGEINEKYIYYGGLYLAANKNNVTTNWSYKALDYTTKKNLNAAIIEEETKVVSNPYWAITGTLLTQNLEVDSAIVDNAINNKKYLVSNGDFDLETCQFNGTYIEIGSYSGSNILNVIVNSSGDVDDGGIHDDTALWVD